MRIHVQSLALLSGLRIQRCCELWCRSQMRLRSCVAVALVQASSCGSNWTPSLGTSICCKYSPKKKDQKKKKNCFFGASEMQGIGWEGAFYCHFILFYCLFRATATAMGVPSHLRPTAQLMCHDGNSLFYFLNM